MKTLRERCLTEEWIFAKANFLDEFRTARDASIVQDSVLDLDNLSSIQKADLAASVDQLCDELKLDRPDWIYDPSTFLREPYFAMNAKGVLRIMLIQESPKWFRSRNLFVTSNCLDRI